MSVVFVDSSGWIALLSRDDRRHPAAVARYRELAAAGARLVTNNYVTDETATRLRYGLGLAAALDFRRMCRAAEVRGRLRIAWVDEPSEAEAWRILEQYADVRLSLTDAAGAATARAARASEIFGCDRDFEALGFSVVPGPG